jgi:dihydroorotate dehydrogenase electron transfer subunit
MTKEELLFAEEAHELGAKVDISTEDGSLGHQGVVTDRVELLLGEYFFDLVLVCGPEMMIKKTVEIAETHNVKIQASLERYMKCGIGICDSCAIDGYQVCRDGPVFHGHQLAKMIEFGRSKRDPSGKRIGLDQ